GQDLLTQGDSVGEVGDRLAVAPRTRDQRDHIDSMPEVLLGRETVRVEIVVKGVLEIPSVACGSRVVVVERSLLVDPSDQTARLQLFPSGALRILHDRLQ